MEGERRVAGIRCSDVLALLPDFVEGALAPADAARAEAHLAGCDRCERFGDRYAATVAALRRELTGPAPLDAGVRDRLRARVAREG